MKKTIALSLALILFASCLASCDLFEPKHIDETTEHIHQWKDVSGEHARICTECNEKQLKPEACKFVRESCGLPSVCSVCYAVGDEAPEEHDWQYASQTSDCWSTTIIYSCSKCSSEQSLHGDSVLPNHSWVEETADGKTTLSCNRCNESIAFMSEIGAFSYSQVLDEYKIGDPGVKHENFYNPAVEREDTNAIDAIIRARFDVTVEYDTISVSYDEVSDVWCVNFYTFNIPGGGQSVYLNGNGLTCYIVYGE